MTCALKAIFAAIVLMLSFAAPMTAGPLEDLNEGLEAFYRKDYETARRIWRSRADQGNAYAQSALGVIYGMGLGVPNDMVEATRWDCKSADQGIASAPFSLGGYYDRGWGVP